MIQFVLRTEIVAKDYPVTLPLIYCCFDQPDSIKQDMSKGMHMNKAS